MQQVFHRQLPGESVMRRRISSIELLAATLFLSVALPDPAALAAPFCLVAQGIAPQCIYDNPTLCARDATRQGGACEANSGAALQVQGSAQYCVAVAGGHSYCEFDDVNQCLRAAQHEHAACIAAPALPAAAPTPSRQQTQASG
jgi:hypothetical protein